jgi:anti-sigma-K factor RskA
MRPEDMTHDELAALVSAHALHALDPEEAAMVERLIESSPEWRAAFEDALETAAGLALVPAAVDPPAGLRDRILDAARAEPQGAPATAPAPEPVAQPADELATRRAKRERFALRLFAASMAVAAVVFGVLALTQRQEVDDLRAEAARNQDVATLLASPSSRVVALQGPGVSGGAALVLPQGHAPVLISTLGNAPADRTYQIWAIPDSGGAPRSIGFAGEGSDVIDLPGDAFDGASTVAMTLEPDGGSPAPTTQPFLLASTQPSGQS